jgi:hypothetical protein
MTKANDDDPRTLSERRDAYVRRFSVSLPKVRLFAVILSVAIVAGFLALPMIFAPTPLMPGWTTKAGRAQAELRWKAQAFHPATLWEVGEMSGGHAAFGANCATCHQSAFVRVRSSACLACHTDVGPHADPRRAPLADISGKRCESCHHEHQGQALATRNDPADCVVCHGDLKRIAPETTLRAIHDFATDHPAFSPPAALDPGNVRFGHKVHLQLEAIKSKGAAAAGGTCGLCHRPAAGGVGFGPVAFERDCASCHALQFEPKHPEWRLPHGHPDEVASRVAGFYAGAALAGETFEVPRSDLFAKPGAPLPPPAPTGAAMVSTQTAAAMMSSIARSACGQCHAVSPPPAGAPASAWKVEPVSLPEHFLTKSEFRHDRHAILPCQGCHAVETTDGGPAATLPGIDNCRGCHSGNSPAAQRVATSCVSCHTFHSALHPVPERKT